MRAISRGRFFDGTTTDIDIGGKMSIVSQDNWKQSLAVRPEVPAIGAQSTERHV